MATAEVTKTMTGRTVLALVVGLAAGFAMKGREASSPNTKAAPAAPAPGTAMPAAGGLTAAPVEHPPGFIGLGRSIIDRFNRDNASQTAAGIAFYLFLSIFPGLAVLVSLYGMIGDPADVGRQIAPFAGLLPPDAMKLLNDGLQSFVKNSTGAHVSIALVTSILLAFWSARAAMAAIMSGLSIAYEEIDQRSFVFATAISLLLTFGAVLFAIVAITAVAVVPAMLGLLHIGKWAETLLFYGRWPVLTAMVVLGFAILYRYAAYRSHPRWRWITWGSAVATVLWLGGSFLFSFYVSHFGSYDATYGSLGAVVVLLLWFWVSSLVMVLGAEIDAELDARASRTGSPVAGIPPSAGPPVDAQAA